MPESTRWYMSKGMYHKVIEMLRRISKVNGKSPEPGIYNEFLKNISLDNNTVENATIFDLRKTPHLRKNIFLLAIAFSFSTLIMDTHIYYSNRYNMSVFISFSWFSLEIFFASTVSKFTANLWGLRFNGFLGLFLTSVFSYTFVFTSNETVKLISGSIGRMSISFIQILYSQYVPEFFPTTFRAQGSGLVRFLSIIVHFIAPYVIVLASTWRELPMLIIATLALVDSFLILFLPETVGKCLRQTLQDGEDFCKSKKFWPIFIINNK
ncbi:solute carrier family 22 member 2-like [Leptopilina heterotoma]|uniref:solute carrier family 22 member 2-like n=1 Tax=Leptopilina heterotoma TaxID=63436 RepID=UPI001CA93589|nr:solute carrier family 22 member 2-like [Leptopilina heterotoma]